MELKGKMVKKLDLETGVSKSGKSWQKQSIVLDNGKDFNNEVCISAFGDKVADLTDLEVGMDVTVLCNVYSREYKGRYYNSIDGYWFSNKSKQEPDMLGKAIGFDNDVPF